MMSIASKNLNRQLAASRGKPAETRAPVETIHLLADNGRDRKCGAFSGRIGHRGEFNCIVCGLIDMEQGKKP